MKRLFARATVVATVLFVLVVLTGAARANTYPGANGKIAFNQGGENDATTGFTINPDGSGLQQIGTPGNISLTNWSPDGSKIIANVWSDAGVQPATANPDGSDFTLVNPNLPLDLFGLFWSPDGTRLLCHSEGIANPADAGLYTVRSSDGGGLVRVTTSPQDGSYDVAYGYSPDGSRILFAHFDTNAQHGILYSVNPDGSDPIQLSPSSLGIAHLDNFDGAGASWSPDGSRVTFAASWRPSAPHGRQFALYVVNADGSGLHRITPDGIGAISAQWSPNGHWIAFSSKRPRGYAPIPQVWVIHPDGTGLRELTFGSSEAQVPIWSPDSKELLFNRQTSGGATSLWIAHADGSGMYKLIDTFSFTSYSWGVAP